MGPQEILAVYVPLDQVAEVSVYLFLRSEAEVSVYL
jgi:hypothetical protein